MEPMSRRGSRCPGPHRLSILHRGVWARTQLGLQRGSAAMRDLPHPFYGQAWHGGCWGQTRPRGLLFRAILRKMVLGSPTEKWDVTAPGASPNLGRLQCHLPCDRGTNSASPEKDTCLSGSAAGLTLLGAVVTRGGIRTREGSRPPGFI